MGGEHWLPGHRNGVWLSRPADELLVRLDLPILEPMRIRVRAATAVLATLEFTPRSWMQPQALPAAAVAADQLGFDNELWGSATVRDVNPIAGVQDARATFAKPDLSSARQVDSTPKYDYEYSYTDTPAALPAYRAYFTDTAPTVDGTIAPEEWPGWDVSRSLALASLSKLGPELPPAGQGYALYDGGSLYIAVRVTATGAALVRQGGTWGPQGTGGIEVDLATFSRRRMGPVFVLHGYPSGKVESVTDGGADAEFARRFGAAVSYKARILDEQSWTCELRVPLAAFGVDLSDINYLRFNLGLRRNGAAGGPWFAAVRTGGANYELATAAVLHLDRGVRADAGNLLTGGDFESEDTTPWRLSTNRPDPAPDGTVTRVQTGRRGDWCMQLSAADPEMMKERVFKWTHPLQDIVTAPGRYCLSYEVRVVGRALKPGHAMGSFNSYLHITRNDKPGGNLGQRDSMVTSTGDRWVRRDVVVDVPADVVPSMVSLQLHRATGTVLIDNVRLVRCTD